MMLLVAIDALQHAIASRPRCRRNASVVDLLTQLANRVTDRNGVDLTVWLVPKPQIETMH